MPEFYTTFGRKVLFPHFLETGLPPPLPPVPYAYIYNARIHTAYAASMADVM